MKKLCTKDEFRTVFDIMMDVMFAAGEAAAEEAGEPVDATSVLQNVLVKEGPMTAEQLEETPCFQCVSRTKIMIGADGTVYDPDDDEEEVTE